MLFCTFSWRYFLKKKLVLEEAKIFRDTKRFFYFYPEALASLKTYTTPWCLLDCPEKKTLKVQCYSKQTVFSLYYSLQLQLHKIILFHKKYLSGSEIEVAVFLVGCRQIMKALPKVIFSWKMGFVSLGLGITNKRLGIGLEFGIRTNFVLGNGIYTPPLLTFCYWFKSWTWDWKLSVQIMWLVKFGSFAPYCSSFDF